MSLPIPSTSQAPIDPKQLQAMDAPLIALTQQCGGDLRRVLFAFFSFLHRRTDFYLVPHPDDKESSMGFREGDAEKLLVAAFRQFPLRRIPKGGPPDSAISSSKTPPTTKATQSQETAPSSSSPTAPVSKEKDPGKSLKPFSGKSEPTSESSTIEKGVTVSGDNSDLMAEVRYTEEGLQVPVGNGGSTKRYKWTQTIEECTVLVGVPKTLRGKDLNVKINATSLLIQSKKPLTSTEKDPTTFLEGNLVEKIRAEESTWSVEGGVVIVTLDKLKQTFWKTVIEGDEEIDTELVDNRRHIGEYDEATQAKIRKIIFDQEQSHKGGPTSDESLGQKSPIPPLPEGVEYIDRKKLDEEEKRKKKIST